MSATKVYVDATASGTSSNAIITTTATGNMASGNLTLSTAGTLISGYHNMMGPGLTIDELRELEALEKEYKDNLKIRRIAIFKSMPSTMRQQVVDYLNFKRYLYQIERPADEYDLTRLYELRRKDTRISLTQDTSYWGQGHTYYSEILNFLTEEEVLNAHAEESLEESLLNAKTDSI